MRWVLLVLVLTPLAMAGCMGGGGSEESEDGSERDPVFSGAEESDGDGTLEGEPQERFIEWHDCIYHLAAVPVPVEDARSHLPEGFEPVLFGGQGELATALIFGGDCENTTTSGSVTADTGHFWFALAVRPPEQYRDERFTAGYILPLSTIVSSDEELAALHGFNLTSAVKGQVVLDQETLVDPVIQGELAGQGDGMAARIRSVFRSASDMHGYEYRIFVIRDGGVVGALDAIVPATSLYVGGESLVSVEQGTSPLGMGPFVGLGWVYHFPAGTVSQRVVYTDLTG